MYFTCEITILPLKVGLTPLASYRHHTDEICSFPFSFFFFFIFYLHAFSFFFFFLFFICTPHVAATGSPSLLASDAIKIQDPLFGDFF